MWRGFREDAERIAGHRERLRIAAPNTQRPRTTARRGIGRSRFWSGEARWIRRAYPALDRRVGEADAAWVNAGLDSWTGPAPEGPGPDGSHKAAGLEPGCRQRARRRIAVG